MQIADFDHAPAAEAAALVRSCADVDRWVEAVVAGRPYGSVETLLVAAEEMADAWDAEDLQAALADHPRIGERHAEDGASAAMSGREQAGVDTTDRDVAVRLAVGNELYEQTFNRIFLVRAAGRSAEDILDNLAERLQHDPETEVAVTLDHLREIAALRLKGLFA